MRTAQPCPNCDGFAAATVRPTGTFLISVTCPACGGTGTAAR